MTATSILIVEDQRVVARDIGEHLVRLGHSVAGVTTSGAEAVRLAGELRPDLVLMDIHLEGAVDGVEAAREIRERLGLPVVYLTAYADDETLRRAKVTEPFGYILKPFEERELRTVIEMALYKHQAERKLRESERRYAVTLSSIGDAVIATDEQGRVSFMNPAAEALTGWSHAEATGRPLVEVFHIINEQTRQPVENPAAKVLRDGVVVGLANHTLLLSRHGGERPIDDSGAPIRDDRGRMTGVVLVFHDVTEQRRSQQALALFRSLLDRTTDAIEVVDPETGRFLDVNESACRAHGYTREEYLALRVPDLDPVVAARPWPEFREETRRAGSRVLESLHRRKDGATFPVEVSVTYIRLDRDYFLAVVRDITERKRAEEALRRSETSLVRAQRIAHLGDWEQQLDPDRLRWSDEVFRIFGVELGEFTGTSEDFFRRVHPDDVAAIRGAVAEAIRLRRPYSLDHRIVRPDGTVCHVHEHAEPVYEEAGRATALVGTVQDITERKRAEEALRESQERLRLAVQATGLGPWDWDLRTGAVDFSPEWKRQLGYEGHEIPGRYEEWEGLLHSDDRERVLGALRDYLEERQPDYAVEFRLRHKDGSYRWIYTRAVALRDEGSRPYRMLGCHLDITERRRAEEALRESHGLLNAVVEGTSDAVFVKDLNGCYLLINSAGARLFGRPASEILGQGDHELLPPEAAHVAAERDSRVMASGSPQTLEETATVAGARRTFLTTRSPFRNALGRVAGLVGISRDVTELKLLEEQYLQAQKMEAVGRLAGGIAHDFNNLLTVINGYADVLFGLLRSDDPGRESLAEILKAGERAATLTRQLLAFSRKQLLQPQVVNLNALLGDLVKLLQRLIGEDVELALVAAPGLGLTTVDPGQFEQAVINLAVNARDAMSGGGRLTIATRNADLDVGHHPEVRPGRYVLVAVTDTGCGMDEATRARVFEPFFTTKEPGKGTGLGLAMVYGFVMQSGGHVEVDSEPGRGTTFRVYLPRTEAGNAPPKSSPDLHKLPKGTETVLLVEDEDAVRALARLVLQTSGYTVLEARDGQDGMWVAQQHASPIHLLVTDLVMPRMSGRQLADLLVRERPGLRVLFMSGYTDEVMLSHGVGAAGVSFLQKPFSPSGLAQRVREVLDQQP
jgi:PAS domain S-box-containing protein